MGTRVDIERPRLWQPGRPALYSLSRVGAPDRARTRRPAVGTYRLSFGVRKLETPARRALPERARLRPARREHPRGRHQHGRRAHPGHRARSCCSRLRDLGATVTRSHYPLHPAFLEALDRLGILYWAQAPVYQLPNSFFDLPGVRASATRAVRLTVENNLNHPSVFAWSLVNEPAGSRSELGRDRRRPPDLHPRGGRRGARARRHAPDRDRPPVPDRRAALQPGLPLPRRARGERVLRLVRLGAPGPGPAVHAPRSELGPYLDELHRANPALPLVITEFGAEASRHGPGRRSAGTYEFQTRYTLAHLRIHDSKRYVAGSIAWALRDFRVEAGWQGGAPLAYATSPWNNKSLIEQTNAAEARVLRAAQALAAHEAARVSGPLRCAAVKTLALSRRARRRRARADARSARKRRRPATTTADKRGAAIACLTEDKGLDGARGGQGRGHRRTTPRPARGSSSTSRAGRPRRAQFEGEGEGAEQIGSALLFVRDGDRRRAREVERCLNDL